MTKNTWHSTHEDETRRLGARLAAELAPDGVLLLEGDLGCGKTVLAQGVAEGLGIARSEVQSPTFVLVRGHEGTKGRLVHADLYRLAAEDVEGVGLDELLAGPGVKVIEWADRLPFTLPESVYLRFSKLEDGSREIRDVSHETVEKQADCTTDNCQ